MARDISLQLCRCPPRRPDCPGQRYRYIAGRIDVVDPVEIFFAVNGDLDPVADVQHRRGICCWDRISRNDNGPEIGIAAGHLKPDQQQPLPRTNI